MHDITFRQVITNTKKYVDELKSFGAVVSPDCSLYLDMPLVLQQANTYLNRAVGHYLQRNGITVIPNVRWSDERSFEFCFLGLEKHGVYSISTHGCIRGKKQKIRFEKGLSEMIKTLDPKMIIVHGSMPLEVFEEYLNKVTFVQFDSYIAQVFAKRL